MVRRHRPGDHRPLIAPCTFDDPDGARVVIRWTAEAAASAETMGGAWTLPGGSGRRVGATGSGSYALVTDPAGRFSNAVGGAVTVP